MEQRIPLFEDFIIEADFSWNVDDVLKTVQECLPNLEKRILKTFNRNVKLEATYEQQSHQIRIKSGFLLAPKSEIGQSYDVYEYYFWFGRIVDSPKHPELTWKPTLKSKAKEGYSGMQSTDVFWKEITLNFETQKWSFKGRVD